MQIVSFRFTVNSVREATIATKDTLLNQLVERINAYMAGMERISRIVAADAQVREFLQGNTDVRLARDIEERFSYYTEAREDVSSIAVLKPDGHALAGGSGSDIADWAHYQTRTWYRDTIRADGETVISGSYVQDLLADRYEWVVSMSQAILAPGSGELLGILLVDLRFNRIRELCESFVVGDNGYTFILDDQGRYVFHPAQQLVYSGIRSEPRGDIVQLISAGEQEYRLGDTHYLTAVSQPTGWYVVSVSYDSDLGSGWGYVQVTYAVIGLAVFVILGLITNFISQGVTRPVHQLQEVMRSVETGEFREAGELNATDEIRELAQEYNLMVSRIRDLMDANAREQELKRKSDLKALQAQINPHFLYNTLDSIVWMGEMGRNREVVEMTTALSRLFRISISRGREHIRLRDEIDHVRNYLTIQKMRYEDKFEYSISVDESLLDLTVLKIILQPLVENAIYHGVRDLSHPGRIEISANVSNGSLHIQVRDDGLGMGSDELESLRDLLKNSRPEEEDPGTHGVGVRNVNERIQLYFGRAYGLEVDSEPERGTTITCRLPSIEWSESL